MFVFFLNSDRADESGQMGRKWDVVSHLFIAETSDGLLRCGVGGEGTSDEIRTSFIEMRMCGSSPLSVACRMAPSIEIWTGLVLSTSLNGIDRSVVGDRVKVDCWKGGDWAKGTRSRYDAPLNSLRR